MDNCEVEKDFFSFLFTTQMAATKRSLAQAYAKAKQEGTVVDVSGLKDDGSGYRGAKMPKQVNRGRKKMVSGVHLISDNHKAYSRAIAQLGLNQKYADDFAQMFGKTTITNERNQNLKKKEKKAASPKKSAGRPKKSGSKPASKPKSRATSKPKSRATKAKSPGRKPKSLGRCKTSVIRPSSKGFKPNERKFGPVGPVSFAGVPLYKIQGEGRIVSVNDLVPVGSRAASRVSSRASSRSSSRASVVEEEVMVPRRSRVSSARRTSSRSPSPVRSASRRSGSRAASSIPDVDFDMAEFLP